MLNELKRERSPECLTDLTFDEWTAGELSAERAFEVERHVASCATCTARKRALDADAAAFLAARPSAPVKPQNVMKKARSRFPWAGAGTVLTLAAAAAVFFLASPRDVGHVGVRVKGGPHIGFYVKRGELVTPGADGERVRAGDRVRFTVTADHPVHLAILSLDSRGVVSVFSSPDVAAAPLGPATELPLEASVELDDSPGTERVFSVFCDAPIDVARLSATLSKNRELAPPAGCTVDQLSLTKEAP